MKKHALLPILCCLILSGCGDDSGSINADSVECSHNDDCDTKKCVDGKCVKLSEKGEACSDEILCISGLECKDGVCADKDKPEPEPKDENTCSSDDDCKDGSVCIDKKCEEHLNDDACSSDDDCKDGSVCDDKKCIEVKTLEPGDNCVSSDKTAVCPEGLDCYLGKCMTEEEYLNADKCKSDDDCADDASEHNKCFPSGACGAVHPRNDICDDELDICEDGLECVLGICSQRVNEGESCSDFDAVICPDGLMCVDGFCRNVLHDLDKGSECNTSYLFCKDGLICRDAACIAEKAEDESCDDKYDICKTGLACLKGMCTPFGDKCDSTADCLEKDSYCCKSDDCGLNGYCIPYDETTQFDNNCRYKTKPGIFESQIQCRWQPPADHAKNSKNVEIPPIVGHFGNDAGLDTVVSFYSYSPTAIRFINPETCETLETIETSLNGRWYNYPTSADLNGDGLMEVVYVNSSGKPVAYRWDAEQKKHVLWWTADAAGGAYLMTYDVNGDTIPEVIAGDGVFNGQTGKAIVKPTKNFSSSKEPAIGNFDNNKEGLATMVIANRILKWNSSKNAWDAVGKLPVNRNFLAYADFGTAGDAVTDFDFKKLDGIPEIVSGGGGVINIIALKPKGDGTYDTQNLLQISLLKPVLGSSSALGGPLTIGDFDNDGLPEIGVASSGYFGVYDPLCSGYKAGECADKYVLWERWSQDASSGVTGSTLFDFDGDGQAEAVYGDECFTRVYDGKTGKVLFSTKRSSGTASEAPVVADIDGDGSAEMVMGSAGSMSCYDDSKNKVSGGVDPIHEGIPCLDDEDCPMSKNCNKSIGLCTCTLDSDCNTQYMNNKIVQQYVCAEPIHPDVGMMTNPDGKGRKIVKNIGSRPDGYNKNYKVCRASRKTTDIGISDLIIYKDRLDRWVSSRALWNQHQYNIINIEDDGKVPTVQKWIENWLLKNTSLKIEGTDAPRPVYNNYRLNKQGQFGAGAVPDITGRFIAGSICGQTEDGRHVISGKLCNRGTKPVSTKLPASFFFYDKETNQRGERICTSYTNAILGVGQCDQVGCDVTAEELKNLENKDVIMITNLDENGFASTVECNSDNNTDITHIESCTTDDPIVIIN